MSDGYALPNGVTIRMPGAGALDAQRAQEHQEIDHWVLAVRSRGLRLSSVPDEYRERVHARLCEVLVVDADIAPPNSNRQPPDQFGRQGETMSVVSEVLAFLAPAAAAVKASLNGEVAAEVPKLTDEGLSVLENVVAPKLDVPAEVIALAKGENAAIEAAANPFLESELDLLIARIPT